MFTFARKAIDTIWSQEEEDEQNEKNGKSAWFSDKLFIRAETAMNCEHAASACDI